jgi:hypothetical protein
MNAAFNSQAQVNVDFLTLLNVMVGTNPSPEGASFKVFSCASSCKEVPAVDLMQLLTMGQLIPTFWEH